MQTPCWTDGKARRGGLIRDTIELESALPPAFVRCRVPVKTVDAMRRQGSAAARAAAWKEHHRDVPAVGVAGQ